MSIVWCQINILYNARTANIAKHFCENHQLEIILIVCFLMKCLRGICEHRSNHTEETGFVRKITHLQLNPFHATGLFFYPMEVSANL